MSNVTVSMKMSAKALYMKSIRQGNEIKALKDELLSSADAIDQLVAKGYISHHPQVELDALTDGMRSVAKAYKS